MAIARSPLGLSYRLRIDDGVQLSEGQRYQGQDGFRCFLEDVESGDDSCSRVPDDGVTTLFKLGNVSVLDFEDLFLDFCFTCTVAGDKCVFDFGEESRLISVFHGVFSFVRVGVLCLVFDSDDVVHVFPLVSVAVDVLLVILLRFRSSFFSVHALPPLVWHQK